MPDTTLEESNHYPTSDAPEHPRTGTVEAGKMSETSPKTKADREKLGAEATGKVVPPPQLSPRPPDALDGLASPFPLPRQYADQN